VLLADLAGTWAWMPLDGSTRSLIELPCGDGPAQLGEDGETVLCRSTGAANQAIVVALSRDGAPGARAARRPVALDVPPASARTIGVGRERSVMWADTAGVWTAPQTDPRRKTRVAPDAPLRGFLPSPDGERAVGVYADQIYADVRHTRPAEVLMTLQLDGQGARRKAIRDGVAVEWSHDSQWVLVQDGASACIMRASGGQYKCWKGYTAASLSSDGHWGLVLGNRDGSKNQAKAKPVKSAKSAKPAKSTKPRPAPPSAAARDAAAGDMPWDRIDEQRESAGGGTGSAGDKVPRGIDEPSDEPEAGEPAEADDDAAAAGADVSVAPPSGPLSLYRIRLEGAFTDRPTLLVKVVDGAAAWIP
jgi:hypothetical protein